MGGKHWVWLAFGLVTAAALAGCSGTATPDTSSPAPTGSGGAPPPIDPKTLEEEAKKGGGSSTKTTGFIQGIVVDQGIRPLGNVSINVVSPGKVAQSATTGANGVFVFQGLAPSTYIVSAQKKGYAAVQSSVEVKAGEDNPPVVKLQLQMDPFSVPSVQVYSWKDGHIECSAAAFGLYTQCEPLDPVLGRNSTVDHIWRESQNVSFIQGVLAWDPTNPVFDGMEFNVCTPSSGCLFGGGASPVVMSLRENGGSHLFNDYIGIHVAPAFQNPTVGWSNVGVAYQQDFEVVVIVCNNFEPPSGYNFLTDGVPTAPNA